MKLKSPILCWAGVGRIVLACLLLVCASGCTDIEYDQKLADARTEWKGNEVAGIWVSKMDTWPSMRTTLLLRPDGTGKSVTKFPAGTHWESSIQWRYSGGGVWTGSGQGIGAMDVLSAAPFNNSHFTMHYNANEILLNDRCGKFMAWHSYSLVFVRAEDEAAVEEHLKKR